MGFAEELGSERYVCLETYRRDGRAVRTPVWFVAHGGGILVVTRDGTGKIKRIRNNASVRVAACTIGGRIKGGWAGGTAEILPDAAEAVRLRNARYGFRARIAGWLSRGRGRTCAVAVRFS